MRTYIFTIGLLFIAFTGISQNVEKIALNDTTLAFAKGTTHSYEDIEGVNTLVLNGRAQVKTSNFANGTIVVDVRANDKRSFAGVTFRKQDDTFEEVYIRMHKSGSLDALQYNPVFNIESNWQLYPEYQAVVKTKTEGWNELKIMVKNTVAEIHINGALAMIVPNLKTDHREGAIGLFALFENRFANLRISKNESVSPVEAQEQAAIEGLITDWQLSEPQSITENINWKDVLATAKTSIKTKTENLGLLPISKFVVKPSRGMYRRNSEDFVIATKSITSDTAVTKLFSFDYSDRIRVYLNGEILFKGNNGFLYKNNQFEGHLKLETNAVPLTLKKGENLLQCVVIETANGWGLMGKLSSE